MIRGGAVYILTNKNYTTLYTGVTSDLKNRIYEHKNKLYPGSFTAKYQLNKLIYYEGFHRIEEAKKNKMEIINTFNPAWKDLFEDVMGW